MMWHGWWNNWWWVVMPVMILAILGGLTAVFFARGRDATHWSPVGGDPAGDAERILNERYARGEIDDDEFRHRRAVLRGLEAPTST